MITEHRAALNNGLNKSFGFMSDASGEKVKRESVTETAAQCNIVKLGQSRPNMAVP